MIIMIVNISVVAKMNIAGILLITFLVILLSTTLRLTFQAFQTTCTRVSYLIGVNLQVTFDIVSISCASFNVCGRVYKCSLFIADSVTYVTSTNRNTFCTRNFIL